MTQRDPEVQELIDRQKIYDCMVRYCRGVDRADAELMLSAYHPDGMDDHGGFVGPAGDYVKFGMNTILNFFEVSMHVIANFHCEIQGDKAHAEIYFIALEKPRGLQREIRGGRYIQQYEKRDGRWGIIESVCILDCDEPHLDAKNADYGITTDLFVKGKKDHSDPSYARPLKVDRSRLTPDALKNIKSA